MRKLQTLGACVLAALLASTASAQTTALQSRAAASQPAGIPAGGPFDPPGTLFDNQQSNGSTSLASQDSTGTNTARSADDFTLTATCASGEFAIDRIRVQMVQADTAPQAFALDLFNDDGTGNAPVAGITPFTTLSQTTQTAFGPFGAGTSIFEASFTTPGLVLQANTKYWISGYGIDAAANSGGFNNFFAASDGASGSSANGVVIAPNAGVTSWTAAEVVIGPPALAFSFAIDGSCVEDGELTITPTALDFGAQAAGSSSASQTVTLANIGGGSLDVSTLTAAAAPFVRDGGTCSTTVPFALAGGSSCTLSYAFAPAAAGAASQTLTVDVAAPGTGSGSIALSGTGVVGTLAYSMSLLDFGLQTTGASVTRTLTLSNTGSGPLQISALDNPTAPFSLSGGSCGALPINLATGGSCTIIYTFAPGAAGAFSQTLNLTSNGEGGGPITLSGRGAVPVQLPASSVLGQLLLLLGVLGVAGLAYSRRS